MANTIDGHFIWYELLTKDPKAAIAFYSEVTGWNTQPFGEGGSYTMWVSGQGPMGGVMALSDEAIKGGTAAPYWIGSVQVADVDATAKQVKQRGGAIHMQPSDVPTVGRYAVLADPQGASFCVFKPSDGMQRHDPAREGEMCWSELMTRDAAKAFDFYSSLFGWQILEERDLGEKGTYRVFGIDGVRLGGMMVTPKGAPMPPMWVHYVSTGDIDAALARAARHGATLMNGPMEVPDGGRVAQLKDPQGAMFALHQAPKAAPRA